MSDALKCWLIYDIGTWEDALLIFERTRGKAISAYADVHGMLFWECVDRGATVRTKRMPHLDSYTDKKGEIFESGPYVLAGCYTDCVRCERYVSRFTEGNYDNAIVIDNWAYCVECAYEAITGEGYHDDTQDASRETRD